MSLYRSLAHETHCPFDPLRLLGSPLNSPQITLQLQWRFQNDYLPARPILFQKCKNSRCFFLWKSPYPADELPIRHMFHAPGIQVGTRSSSLSWSSCRAWHSGSVTPDSSPPRPMNAVITFALYPLHLFDGTAKLLLFNGYPGSLCGGCYSEIHHRVHLAQLPAAPGCRPGILFTGHFSLPPGIASIRKWQWDPGGSLTFPGSDISE